MLDGNVLLRQKRDEVPKGTLYCPNRNLVVFHHYRHYEGLRLQPSVCEQIIIHQTLSKVSGPDVLPGHYFFVILRPQKNSMDKTGELNIRDHRDGSLIR